MERDYYRILGVSPVADLKAIKSAFKALALQHHSDKGGSDEAMRALIEAWDVLKDPQRRRTYDESRAPVAAVAVRKSAAQDARQARQRAEDPRRWSEVDPWLARFASDFTDARYGEVPVWGGVTLPTTPNSVSGAIFIVVGAAIGGGLISVPLFYWLQGNEVSYHPLVLALLAAPLVGGAWLGAFFHQDVGATLSRGSGADNRPASPVTKGAAESPPRGSRIIQCPKCAQKLRVPPRVDAVKVRCQKCGEKFEVAP